MEDQNDIKTKIEALDSDIERAKKALATMESQNPEATGSRVYQVLKSKVMDWTNKRDFLLEQFVLKPLKKKG